jgi:hypothetical protein
LRKPASETGEGGMIWGRLFEGDTQKLLKGDPVVDLSFQFRVGVDMEPLLEEETFHKEQRGIGIIAFATFSDGVISYKDAIDVGPIDSGIDLLHSFDGAVTIEGVEKRDVGKGEVGIDFFEAHNSSRLIDLRELWQKK